MPAPERLRIAHVTPHAWGGNGEVNEYVANVARELCERGHLAVIAAPSDSRSRIRATRSAIREAAVKTAGEGSATAH